MTGDYLESIRIRRAELADAAALARLGRETFVETFGHSYAPEDLAAFLASAQTEAAYAAALEDPEAAIWVALEPGGGFIGFIHAGSCKLPVPGLEPAAGEIRQLYLRGAAQGAGLGTRMLATGLSWLVATGHAPLYVGVWSGNGGAQRLYARHGFEKVGEYDFPVGRHLDREFILRRQQSPPRGPAGS